jgi:fumarate reductase subunit C
MKPAPAYTAYHPRWYRSRVSTYWWLGKWAHLKFILRELSSVFVAFFVALVLAEICAVRSGPEAYAEFQRWLRSPLLVALNVISLFFVLFHAVTWFNLAPRAMALRVGGKRVPDVVIAASNYAAWAGVSALVAWLLLGG